MTIPINPVNVGTTGTLPDPLLQAIQQLLGGYQVGQEGQLRKQEIAQRQEQLKLERDKLKSDQSRYEAEQAQNAALGEGLRSLLLATEQPVQIPAGALPGAAGAMPLSIPSPVASSVAQLPAGAVPQFVQQTRDIRQQMSESRVRAERLGRLDQAISHVKDPEQRQAVVDWFALAENGLQMSETERRTLFPSLAPVLDQNDPARVNAFTALLKTGHFTVGQARHLTGLRGVPGMSDDFKFPPVVSSLANIQRQKNAALLQIADATLPIMNQLETETGGLKLDAGFLSMIRRNVPFAIALNAIVDPKQRQYVAAARRYVDAQRYFLSGQQTSDQEFMNQFMYTVVLSTDDETTKHQKQAMRHVMNTAMRTASEGAGHPSASLEELLRTAKSAGWSPSLIDGIQRQLDEARRWESNAKRGSLYLNDQPTDPSELDTDMMRWEEWVRQNIR